MCNVCELFYFFWFALRLPLFLQVYAKFFCVPTPAARCGHFRCIRCLFQCFGISHFTFRTAACRWTVYIYISVNGLRCVSNINIMCVCVCVHQRDGLYRHQIGGSYIVYGHVYRLSPASYWFFMDLPQWGKVRIFNVCHYKYVPSTAFCIKGGP